MRKEKYIKSSKRKGITYFQVFFTYNHGQDHYSKNFCSADYPTEAQCLNAACKDRDKARAKLLDGTLAKPSTATVNDMFNEYEELFVKRAGTHKLHKWYYDTYIKEEYGSRNVASVTSKDIMASLSALVYQCSKNDLMKIKAIWSCIMKNARINRIILVNPMEEVVTPTSQKIVVPREQYVPEEDIQKMIDYLSSGKNAKNEREWFDQDILALIVRFIRATGIRPAECYAIQRGVSYSFKDRIIHIVQQYGTDDDSDAIVRVKAESMRDLPMTDEMAGILHEAEQLSDHEFIFQTYEGNFQSSRSVGAILERACKATGIKNFHLYALRHSMATHLIKETGDIRGTMEIMGHTGATAAMSLDYARSNDSDKRKLLEIVENSLKRS